jgi:hypothetical protein
MEMFTDRRTANDSLPTSLVDELQERMDRFREQADRAEPYDVPKDGMRGFTSGQPLVPPR